MTREYYFTCVETGEDATIHADTIGTADRA